MRHYESAIFQIGTLKKYKKETLHEQDKYIFNILSHPGNTPHNNNIILYLKKVRKSILDFRRPKQGNYLYTNHNKYVAVLNQIH